MTQREPDLAMLVQCRACAGLRAGRPTRWNARPTRGKAGRRIAHEVFILERATKGMAATRISRIEVGGTKGNIALPRKHAIIRELELMRMPGTVPFRKALIF